MMLRDLFKEKPGSHGNSGWCMLEGGLCEGGGSSSLLGDKLASSCLVQFQGPPGLRVEGYWL